jgi:methionyl-tRNA formyltransferase
LKLAFAGTPEFARAALERLLAAGHDVGLVLTQPDRHAGRGMKLQPSPVKAYAAASGLPVLQPAGLKLDGRWAAEAGQARDALQALRPDAIVVAAYGLILPPWVLELPRLGCLNIHASLLPRWRGAAPIQRAIEAGDALTGVTIMQMDAGLDTGDMLLAESISIHASDTAASLQNRLADLGARLIVDALELASHGRLVATPQPEHGATYARKIDKSEGPIDWSRPAVEIERRIRAFDPFPGATLDWGGETLKCWRAEVSEASGRPGELLELGDAGLLVACGHGALRITEMQRPGGRRQPSRLCLQGRPLPVGHVLGRPAA